MFSSSFSSFSFQEKDLSSIFYSPLAIFSTPLLFTRARSLRNFVEKDCSLILLSLSDATIMSDGNDFDDEFVVVEKQTTEKKTIPTPRRRKENEAEEEDENEKSYSSTEKG